MPAIEEVDNRIPREATPRWVSNQCSSSLATTTASSMPILFLLLALALPRGLIVGLWLLTDWFQGIFPGLLWPLLGFVFLPATLLWYSAVQNWFGGEWGLWQIVGMVAALMLDTSPARGRGRGSGRGARG